MDITNLGVYPGMYLIFTVTLDFNLLLKNYSECLFVSLECSLQSSDVCFEVCSDNVQ